MRVVTGTNLVSFEEEHSTAPLLWAEVFKKNIVKRKITITLIDRPECSRPDYASNFGLGESRCNCNVLPSWLFEKGEFGRSSIP